MLVPFACFPCVVGVPASATLPCAAAAVVFQFGLPCERNPEDNAVIGYYYDGGVSPCF